MAQKNVDGFNLTFDSDWTQQIESQEHWSFYWHQAKLVEMHTSKDDQLVEIGVGSGFLQNYLQSKGWHVSSVDIDAEKKPDFVSDASQFDFFSLSPRCFIAFEIFEHIPYPLLERTISNITKPNPEIIIFSIPLSVRFILKLNLKIPKTPNIKINIPIPKRKVITKNHYWELSLFGNTEDGVLDGQKRGLVSLSDVRRLFSNHGYSVDRVGRADKIQFFVASTKDT